MTALTNNRTHRIKRVAIVILKTVLWLIAIPVLLILLTFTALQFKSVQQLLTHKATGYLSHKLHSKVQLASLTIEFPGSISLKELYVEDQGKDTLLYSHALKVDIDLWALLSKKIELNQVELETATGHIYRNDSSGRFNFSFIPEAFASPHHQDTVKQSSASPWQFNIQRAILKNVYFTYHDRFDGLATTLVLRSLEADVKTFDLNKKKISANTLALAKARVIVKESVPLLVSKDTTASTPFDVDLGAKTITLDSVITIYENASNGQYFNSQIGKLQLEDGSVNVAREKADANSLLLHNSMVNYRQEKTLKKEPAKQENISTPFNWHFSLQQLDLQNNRISYNDNNKTPEKPHVIDFAHLAIQQLSMKATNIKAGITEANMELKDLHFIEQSGFQLKQFKAKIHYDSTHLDLSNLNLQTGNSHLNDHLAVRYRSLQQLQDSLQQAEFTFNFHNTRLAAKDLLYFAPEVLNNKQVKINPATVVSLAGKLHGTLNQLTVSQFKVSIPASTRLNITGQINNLMQPSQLYINAKLELSSTRRDVTAIVPDSILPENMAIPDSFSIKGAYTGYFRNFNADLALSSSFGEVHAAVTMNPKAGNILQPYNSHISTANFNLGKLLKQPETFGVITLKASVNGSGFDTSSINTTIALDIEKAEVKHYPYSNFTLNGKLSKKSFSGTAAMNDNNLAFTFNGAIDLEPAHPRYTFTLDLSGADLKALNLSEEDLRVSLLLQSDINSAPGQNVTGRASIKKALVIRNNHRYPVDSLVLSSQIKDSIYDLHLRSDMLTADMNGIIVLSDLPEAMRQHLDSYFAMQAQPSHKPLKRQDFKFEMNLTDPSLLVGNLIPKLQKLTPFSVKGAYNSQARSVALNMNVPQIQYDSIMVDSLKLNISSDEQKLTYQLNITEASDPTFKFENVALKGNLQNNELSFQLNTAKDDSAKLLSIGGILKSKDHELELKLNPDLIINTQKWNIDNNNALYFSKQGMYANHLDISNGKQMLSLNSKENKAASPLEISFRDFDMTTVSRLIENKKDLLAGEINGSIVLEKQNGAQAFRSDLVITDFALKTVPVGTIRLKADNFNDPSRYQLNLQIEGHGNDVVMSGVYTASKNSQLDVVLDIRHLNLESVEPFTFGQVTRMSGSLNGKLAIKGDAKLPMLNGDVYFKEAAFRPRFINSYLTVPDARLGFDGRKIRLNNFTLLDSLQHKAIADGSVDINDLKRILLDLHIKTDDFLALNTTRKDNPLYYGTIIIDSDIRVKGTADEPVVDAKLKLNKGTTVTYVKPENEISKNESKGIVEFIDTHAEKNIAIMARQNDSISGLSRTRGFNMHASVDIDRSAQLKVIVDPSTGDSLFIRGGGLVDFNLDPSGRMSLAGKYRINDGGYYLSLENVVKRNFKIQKGSTVSWSGDALDPYVELTAIYSIKTSPLDLVSDELNGVDEMEKNRYRNLLTFNVYLKMTGFISSPQISFDIQLAAEDRGALNGAVNSKLGQLREDETQLNKQVFALLTLGRFVGENPLESSSDGGLSSASRASASKVLTQQLSSLSGKYVKFIDLDLGVNSFEDYSTGQEQGRTQLQVGVSKQLFKKRVTVRVGGNVDLEGERASQNDVNDVAGNVNIDYKLTEDGRYKLKGFRENQYENPIEGELTKTGAGVAYLRNFNSLKELLSKPKPIPVPKEKKNKDNDDEDEDEK